MIDRPHSTGILVNPSRTVKFTFDGKAVHAIEGQSIAAALYGAGIRIFSRSYQEHRPRGLLCMSGDCANCLMRVDGRDNVRTCIEPARHGQKVVHQGAWPSLTFDMSWLFDRFSQSRRRWLESAPLPQSPGREVEELTADVCVIGGGPAGIAAASEAADAGAEVMIIERLPRLGGHFLFDGTELAGLDALIASLSKTGRVHILTGTTAYDLSPSLQVSAFHDKRFVKIQAKQVIVCTGGRERPFVFHNNDLPGIMLCRAAQRLGRLYGIPPGRNAVVVTDHAEGPRMAEELVAFGVDIKAVIDPRPATWGTRVGRGWDAQSVLAGKSMSGMSGQPAGWQLQTSSIILEAIGRKHLKAVKVVQVNPSGSIAAKSDKVIECDLLCIASALLPVNELLLTAGVRYEQEDGRWRAVKTVSGVSAAGAAAGTAELAAQVLEGKLRGGEAADALGYTCANLDRYRADYNAWLAKPPPKFNSNYFPYLTREDSKRFVCLCADVTQLEMELALVEGCDSVEAVKRHTKATRGPCQGRMCDHACIELVTLRLGEQGPKPTAASAAQQAESPTDDDKPTHKPGQPRIPLDG